MSLKWKDVSLVAFDLETSGKYPLSSEICEIAAVRYKNGQIDATFETLIRPESIMSNEVIAIHGITNEMVADAPRIAEKIGEFAKFCEGSVMMAHHSPFDMGFLAWELERAQIPLDDQPVLCSSLLSRALIPESANHKLVTLAKHLGIDPGNSHRALDDAKTCLEVGIQSLKRLGEDATIEQAIKAQGQLLKWKDFSINDLIANPVSGPILTALFAKSQAAIVYTGGSKPGQERTISPTGIVRGPGRDFIIATDKENQEKRYYLERITKARTL